MMEAAPASAFEVIQAQLVLELLVVPLDPPAELSQPHELGEGRRRRQGREPVLRGLGFPARPLDQEILFRAGLGALLIAMRGPNADPGEAGAHGATRPFAPAHRVPARDRHRRGQALEANGPMAGGATDADRRTTAADSAPLRRQGHLAWAPPGGLAFDADHVRQPRG